MGKNETIPTNDTMDLLAGIMPARETAIESNREEPAPALETSGLSNQGKPVIICDATAISSQEGIVPVRDATAILSQEGIVPAQETVFAPDQEWSSSFRSDGLPAAIRNVPDYSDLDRLKSEVSEKDSLAINQELYETTKMKKQKNRFTIFSVILSVLLTGALAFGGYQTVSAIKYNKIAATNKTYYEQEQKRATDLDDQVVKLKDELSKTDAGKKALEEMNKNLENENGVLDQKATSAEEQMKIAQADLAAKQAELVKINSSLATKKTELEKAQRGIAKFAEVEKLYISFKTKKDEFAGYNALIIGNINDYLSTGNDVYIDYANANLALAESAYNEMEKLNVQMNSIFDIIKSGNY